MSQVKKEKETCTSSAVPQVPFTQLIAHTSFFASTTTTFAIRVNAMIIQFKNDTLNCSSS